MTALQLTGTCHNIAYYAEPEGGPVWAEVLCSALERVQGAWRAKRVPTYYVTVYRRGSGEVARKTYQPTTRPRPVDPLPARTVTRLVRAALEVH